jgi:hypothetical protein
MYKGTPFGACNDGYNFPTMSLHPFTYTTIITATAYFTPNLNKVKK